MQGLASFDIPGCPKNIRRALLEVVRSQESPISDAVSDIKTNTEPASSDVTVPAAQEKILPVANGEKGDTALREALHAANLREAELLEQNSILTARY